ncbi:hypothetical protein DAI22_03g044050 [Oryza sativa Japonica Group]|nr:hypothetical protein DAI22_03g044050 [Oryza sativa Japonica Group]
MRLGGEGMRSSESSRPVVVGRRDKTKMGGCPSLLDHRWIFSSQTSQLFHFPMTWILRGIPRRRSGIGRAAPRGAAWIPHEYLPVPRPGRAHVPASPPRDASASGFRAARGGGRCGLVSSLSLSLSLSPFCDPTGESPSLRPSVEGNGKGEEELQRATRASPPPPPPRATVYPVPDPIVAGAPPPPPSPRAIFGTPQGSISHRRSPLMPC